ncbi:lantibiotic ABC transporter [Anaerococcus jeddahensis]|uniref:lantibiotic ABC transporter n=1 Tax=Anaerococcus jeddahensis TaxID=1673719 RepID=UPI0006724F11|nr:lantibiotic ABC transporter [Anaerococcus jeddahensis]
MKQISLFSTEENEKNLGGINDGTSQKFIENKYKIYHTRFLETSYETLENLFSGYDEIRAITYSYNIKFINKIINMFEYGELILGGRFMVRRDSKLHKLRSEAYLLAENMTLSELAADYVRKEKDLVKRIGDGSLFIRSPKYTIDHRKIYLLKSNQGKTRVIISSANMSSEAWSGNQIETYEVDDTINAYDTYLEDFETAWNLSDDIPEEVVASSKKDDPEKDIPIIKKAIKTQEAILLEKPDESDEIYERIKYTLDADKIMEKNKILVNNIKANSKKDFIEIVPDLIKRISVNSKIIKRKKLNIKEIQTDYPNLTFDYNNGEVFLNDKVIDLNPKKEDVKKDIELLFETMDNYKKDFIGDIDKLRDSHYKLLNIMFSSPFNAKLRCVADIKNIPTSSLPLFTLIASSSSNTGKTFMTELILKLMTNMNLKHFSTKEVSTAKIDMIQETYKGLPIFVDEIDGHYYGRLKEKIKNSKQCENSQREEQALFIFASNEICDPGEPERKRMPFLKYNSGLKKDIDPVAYDGISKNIKARATNALYREYLRIMIEEVNGIINYMIGSNDIADDYYPDIIKISSNVLIQIFKEHNFDLPDYVRELNWNEDFSYHAKYISQDAIEEIRNLWESDPNCFIIKTNIVIIKFGSDKTSKKILESWTNSLPGEFECKYSCNREMSKVKINRKQLENALGFKFNKLFKFFRR